MRLTGKRILVVEDDYRLADEVCQALRGHCATVLGPAPTPYYAMHLLGRRGVDAAILDDRLHGTTVFELADELARRGVPFVLTNSDAPENFPERFQGQHHLSKPYDLARLVDIVANLANSAPPASSRDFEPEYARLDDGELNSRTRILRAISASMRRAAQRSASASEDEAGTLNHTA